MQVVVRPHLLSNREQQVLEGISYGMSIAEVVSRLPMLDEGIRDHNLAVLIDGEVLPRDKWETRNIGIGDQRIEFAVVLEGGGRGGSGKQIMMLVAMIALTVVSMGAATALAAEGFIAASSVNLVASGIMMVGSLALHAIFAPPKTDPSHGAESSPTYSFSGQSNQPRRFARLPRIYGKHRYVADLAAMPYTVYRGTDTYINCLYSFGYGPLTLEDFRIGQNPLTNYKDVQIEIHTNFTDASQLKIFKNDVWQDSLSLELKQATPVTVTTQTETESAIVDISFPQGLMEIDEEGNWFYQTADMKFEYRTMGVGSFEAIPVTDISRGATDAQQFNIIVGGQHYPGIPDPTEVRTLTYFDGTPAPTLFIPGWPAGTTVITAWEPIEYQHRPVGPGEGLIPGSIITMGQYTMTVQSIAMNTVGEDAVGRTLAGRAYEPVLITLTAPLPGNLQVAGDDANLTFNFVPPVSLGSNELRVREKQQNPFTISAGFTFPAPGQYEIRITKTDADFADDDLSHLWRRYVTSIRSIKNQPPIKPEVMMTVVELSIKATGQLSGNVEQFSAVATSILRVWQEGSGWIQAPTRSPAWVYLDLLQGTANNRPLPDSRIDLTALRNWAVFCDEIVTPFVGPTGTCDCVIDRQYTVWELLQNVAATGRAAPTMHDNKYSVLLDLPGRTPVQMFTARNSRNLSSTRTFIDEPHALRIKWIDPLKNYEEAELIVYNTGHDELDSTVFEELMSFGMTRAEQVLRWGRYMVAQGKLRQERFTIDVDIENIVCLRGDLVLVAHDVIQVGGDACRIVEVDGTRLFVDAPPSMEDTTDVADFGVRVRRADGYISGVLDLVAVGNDGEFDYVDVAGDLTGIIADNLLVLGPKSQVVGEYLVASIRPANELSAQISLEEYSPAIYDAEFNGLENLTYTPQGSGSAAPAVTNMVVDVMVSYTNGVPMATVRVSWRPAQGYSYQPDDYRMWMLTPTGNEEFLGVTTALYWDAGPFDLTTLNGFEFIFRVRPFYGARGLGPITEASTVVDFVPRQPPRLMDFFDVLDLPAGARRYVWSFTGDDIPTNVIGIQVRYIPGNSTPVWANGDDVVSEGKYVLVNGAELHSPPGAGVFTFMARTVDAKGQLSTGMYTLVRTLSLALSVDFTPPPTPTGFTATGGFSMVFFEQDTPGYTVGGGHDYTQVYYSTDPGAVFADAIPFSTFVLDRASAGAAPATTYQFWARWVSKAGVGSLVAAGPVTATTAIDVEGTIAALTGQIGEEQLTTDLGTRIDLVDAPAGTAGSVNARVAAEATARAAAVTAETNARIAAINQEVTDRTSAIAVETTNRTNAVAAEAAARGTAVSNEATVRQSGDDALSQQISLVTAGVAGGFDYGKIWYFDATAEAWTSSGMTQTWNAGWLDADATATPAYTISPAALGVAGATYPIVKARIKRLAGSGWVGTVSFTTGGHGFTTGFYKSVAEPGAPLAIGQTAVVEWDMSSLTVGGTDWVNNTITQIRFELSASAADTFSFDWIAIGRNAPGASTAGLASEQTARIAGDTAIASDVTALTARVGTNETNILNETTARTTGDTANANSITALTARVTTAEGNITSNAAAIVTEQTARANADTALSSSITALSAKVEGSFDTSVVWNYDATAEGWTAFQQATLAWQADGTVRWTPTGTTPVLSSPAFSVNGALYRFVRVRLTRVAGTGWGEGKIFYGTAGHGQNSSFTKTFPDPGIAIGQSAMLDLDMNVLTVGGNDWTISTITSMQLRIGSSATGDVFDIDWIAIGRKAPGASNAALITEQTTRAAADSANASSITALSSTINRQRVGMTELWIDAATINNWEPLNGSTGEVALYADGTIGYAMQGGNNAGNDFVWLVHKDLIPFDPNKLYKLSASVRRIAGTGSVYIGYVGVAANGVTLVDLNGANSAANAHYHAANGVAPALNTVVNYIGYTKGAQSSAGDQGSSADPLVPKKMFNATRFLRVLIGMNSPTGTTGTTQIGRIDVTIADADVVAANLVTEQTTRANADTAVASTVTALTARVTTAEGNITSNASAITTEATARANADTAAASTVTALTARVTTAEGNITSNASAITTEATARANADTAAASTVTALTARVSTAEGAIVTEQTTRASADSVLTTTTNTLSARLETRPNLIKNGGFENGLIGWISSSLSPATVSTTAPGWGPGFFAQHATSVPSGFMLSEFFPVVAGATYTLAGDTQLEYASGSGNTCYLEFAWYDAGGSNIAISTGPAINTSHSFATGDANRAIHAFAIVAPAGAVNARAGMVWAGTNVTSVGLRQLKAERGGLPYTPYSQEQLMQDVNAAITTEQTARVSADTALASTTTTLTSKLNSRPNLLVNGGFENGMANWQQGAGVPSTRVNAIAGWGPGFQLTAAAVPTGYILSDVFAAVAPGEIYTMTMDSQLIYASGTDNTIYCYLAFYDAAGQYITALVGPGVNASHDFSSTDANRLAHAFQAVVPAGAVTARALAAWGGTAVTKVGVRQIKVERGALPATPYTQEASIQMQAYTVNGLSAQYTVKVDVNGYVAGFGLASVPTNGAGTVTSTFAVRSDAFYIASPSGPGIAPAMPFIVRTTSTTINGEFVPAGVYIVDAFIQNGTIVSAMIGNAAITNAKIASLDAGKITTGQLAAGRLSVGAMNSAINNGGATLARIEIDINLIRVYDPNGVIRVKLGNLA